VSHPNLILAATSAREDTGNPGGHGELIYLAPILLGLLVAVIVVVTMLGRRGVIGPLDAPVGRSLAFAPIAAALSFGAGAIHASVSGSHFTEYWLFGAFFVAAAIFQVAWGLAYVRWPGVRLALIGVAANGGTILLWLWSRIVGLPLGPTPGESEHVGFVDLIATIFEIVLVGILLSRLASARAQSPERKPLSYADVAIARTFAILAILILVGTAIASVGGEAS
jgi:hypothetical protein